MPQSPLVEDIDNVTQVIKLNGDSISDEYQVLSIEVIREINKISVANIVLIMPHEPEDDDSFSMAEDKDMLPGVEIEVLVGYQSDRQTIFKGIITRQRIRVRQNRSNELILNCSDKAVKMTLGRNNAYFKDMKDSVIISKVIGNHGLESSVDSTDYEHKQMIQYHAVDWDFIIARAEANGLVVYCEDGKVYAKKPGVSESPELELTLGQDVLEFDGFVESQYQMPSITAHSWDMSKQEVTEGKSQEPSVNDQGDITGKKLSDIVGISDYEVHSTGPIERSELQIFANANLLKTRLSAYVGEVRFFGNATPKLNTTIQMKNFGAHHNGNALITSVHHEVKAGRWWTTIGYGLDPELYAVSRPVNTPSAAAMLPAIHGLQNGTVKKIQPDPDGEYRGFGGCANDRTYWRRDMGQVDQVFTLPTAKEASSCRKRVTKSFWVF